MRRRGWLLLVLASGLLVLGAKTRHKLVETWVNPNRGGMTFSSVMIVGISNVKEQRHQFENKFTSHLRGRGFSAMGSYELVPDLAVVEDRQALLTEIIERKIDALIAVRVVRLPDKDEDRWSDDWNTELDEGRTLRQMIDETLPTIGEKAKHFGVEVEVWEVQSQKCVWAARTDLYTEKQLKKAATDFVDFTMARLRMDGVL
jgi:hypothetical protein